MREDMNTATQGNGDSTVLSRQESSLPSGVRKSRLSRRTSLWSGGLLVPVLVFFILMNVVPTIWMLGLSFYQYTLTSAVKKPKFVGFDNYIKVVNDGPIALSIGRTFLFMVLAVLLQTVLGALIGFLFWRSDKMPGRRLALTLLFTPMVLTPLSSGLFWRLLLDPVFGLVNYLISLFGIERINFLTNTTWAFPSVLVVDTWMWTPFMALMTLAALGSVPKAELESAQVDNLSLWQRLVHVIVPYAKFIIILGILLRTIDVFKTMDLVYLMTNGGPGDKTELIGVALYRLAFKSFNLGYSSALAVFLLLIAIALTSIYLFVLNLRTRNAEEG
jgi:multiple sugar transport system permease protein